MNHTRYPTEAEWIEIEREACIRHGISIPLKPPKRSKKSITTKTDVLFLKGPYPINWQAKAASISFAALAVGNALWLMKGLTGSNTVYLSKDILDLYHISRWTYYRCLEEMEVQGLISIFREGKKPLKITIIYP